MSKRRRCNPNNKFVMIERWFWRSPAWQALPHIARSLYIELELLYAGHNNGELYLSARDAARLLRTGLHQAQAAFHALEKGGFIRATRRGALTGRGQPRMATCWALTKHELWGDKPTAEFMAQKNPTVAAPASERCRAGNVSARLPLEIPADRCQSGNGQADSGDTTAAAPATHLDIPPDTNQNLGGGGRSNGASGNGVCREDTDSAVDNLPSAVDNHAQKRRAGMNGAHAP